MRTIQGAILGLVLACLPAIAQVPQTTPQTTVGTELPGWGTAIDPDKDCKFTPGPGSLTIDVPAAWHDLTGGPDCPKPKLNSPRVLREVDGDFVLTVKVSGDFMPRLPTTRGVLAGAYLGAGILLWSDSDHFIRLERVGTLHDGRIGTGINFFKHDDGDTRGIDGEALKEGDCYLRLERKGGRFLGAFSNGGAFWKQLRAVDTDSLRNLQGSSGAASGLPPYLRTDYVWPKKLKVGLTAISTSSAPFSVKFEQFDLKTKGAQ
jgi:regulation of enolase protein 1 (concanavalin A-like superfamily)